LTIKGGFYLGVTFTYLVLQLAAGDTQLAPLKQVRLSGIGLSLSQELWLPGMVAY
jgi:hypothetical protein